MENENNKDIGSPVDFGDSDLKVDAFKPQQTPKVGTKITTTIRKAPSGGTAVGSSLPKIGK